MHNGNSPVIALTTRLFFGLSLLVLGATASIACGIGIPKEPVSPSPTPVVHAVTGTTSWKATPVLEERILNSDLIVRGKLLTAEAKTREVPGKEGEKPTFVPVVEFVFQVNEYLKGDGPAQITVDDYTNHNFEDLEEAVFSAESRLRFRNSEWDEHEAVIFLEVSNLPGTLSYDAGGIYNFADPIPKKHGGYHLDSINKVWLPAKDIDSQGGGPYLADSVPDSTSGELPTLTLADLRREIADAEELLKSGEGVEGFEQCFHLKHDRERYMRAVEEITGKPWASEPGIEYKIASGLPSGTVISGGWIADRVQKHWLEGFDAELFQVLTLDENGNLLAPFEDDGRGTYDISRRTARPLPAGQYKFRGRVQMDRWEPCNYVEPLEAAPIASIVVTAPTDAKLEAFYDPVGTGEQSFGAGNGNGVLKPGSFFTAESSGFTVNRIEWSGGSVGVQLTPHNPLAGHHIDFIALDGTVSLRLDFDDAVAVAETDGSQALSWGVCEQPWEDGDKLMIRISETGADLTGATNDAECAATAAA